MLMVMNEPVKGEIAGDKRVREDDFKIFGYIYAIILINTVYKGL